jgi:hypothetical protein
VADLQMAITEVVTAVPRPFFLVAARLPVQAVVEELAFVYCLQQAVKGCRSTFNFTAGDNFTSLLETRVIVLVVEARRNCKRLFTGWSTSGSSPKFTTS